MATLECEVWRVTEVWTYGAALVSQSDLASVYSGMLRVIRTDEHPLFDCKVNHLIIDIAARCILSLLPSSATYLTFEPTGCVISSANERSRLHRKPLIQRLLSFDLFMYFAYVIYASIPLLLRALASGSASNPAGSGSFFPFPGPIIKLFSCVWMASVPLRYMVNPPTVPERDELMEIDEANVRRPKRRGGLNKGSDDVSWPWADVCEICLLCWCYLR